MDRSLPSRPIGADTLRGAGAGPAAAEAAARARAARLWRVRLWWWLAFTGALVLLLWLLGPILTPFAVAATLGYFLDPLVSRLQALGLPRGAAAALLVVSMLAVLFAALLLVVPLLAVEATEFLRALPRHYDDLQRLLAQRLPDAALADADGTAAQVLAQLREALTGATVTVFGGVVSGFNGVVRVAVFWLVMPVTAFYLLMDWPRLLRSAEALVPRANLLTVQALARDIDAALAGYVRGVAVVCTILAVYYAALLSAVGLTYGLLVGVIAGAISFVPYIGALVGGSLAIGLALFQFWGDPLLIGLVVAIFLAGQVLESQILVPRLVGNSVNLHPVWLIFAVMAFGYLFGLTGAIIAVPLAAAMGVLVRFAVAEYQRSSLYAGSTELPLR